MRKKPELLIPAGSLEVLKIAVRYGADAVYIGGDAYGLRAKARNFSPEDMREGIAFAHAHGVKVHVTVNIMAHNEDIPGIRTYLAELAEMKPDALIIADPGVFVMAREICPKIDLHISTQASSTNFESFAFWHRMGAARVVAARELSLREIKEIRAHVPDSLEIEAFVHGAMCISYSGRCLLSNYFTGRDGNRGACTHPCRWKYAVVEETRPGEYLPVYENERGTYIFNSKDLCMVAHIPELIDAGIDSFKVEGRMKTGLYVATTARTYRHAIDDYMDSPALYEKNKDWYSRQVSNGIYRPFTTGFYFGKPGEESQIYDTSTYIKEYTYLGFAEEADREGNFKVNQKNKFSVGDEIEVMKPGGEDIPARVLRIRAEDGSLRESAPHPRERLTVTLNVPVESFDVLRKQNTPEGMADGERGEL